MSREKMYQEFGLGSLQLRRWYRELCLFYKISKKHPKYLFNLIPVRIDHMLQDLWAILSLLRQIITFLKILFFHLLLETLKVFQSLRKDYLILYNFPQIPFSIVTILKELNLLQGLESV